MTPQEHAEIKALKDCIRWLINAGNSMSAWYLEDHPRRKAWSEAKSKAYATMKAVSTEPESALSLLSHAATNHIRGLHSGRESDKP